MLSVHSRIALVGLVAAVSVSLSGCTTVSTLWEAFAVSSEPVPTPTESATSAPTGLVTLAVGDCIERDALEDENQATVPFVSCDEPHDLEVYFSLTLDDGDYPSVEQLTHVGATRCSNAFADFVGLDFGISQLDFVYYYPTESSWASGDRGIDCLIFDPVGRVSKSLKHVGR